MNPSDRQWPTMEAGELARLLGWRPQTLSRHKKRLIADHGMPAPLPGGLYARSAVMRWLDTYADRRAAAVRAASSLPSMTVHGDREALERKYAARNAA